MSKLCIIAARLSLCLLAGLSGANATAATVGFGDRVNFIEAVGGQPTVEDDPNHGVSAAPEIVFESGVITTSPGANHPARNTLLPESRRYNFHQRTSEPNVSKTLISEFPVETVSFSINFLGLPINEPS